MKAYCVNCKHYIKHYMPDIDERNFEKNCKTLLSVGSYHSPTDRWYKIDKAFEKNANNNCQDYKRKWWKFWVKEK